MYTSSARARQVNPVERYLSTKDGRYLPARMLVDWIDTYQGTLLPSINNATLIQVIKRKWQTDLPPCRAWKRNPDFSLMEMEM